MSEIYDKINWKLLAEQKIRLIAEILPKLDAAEAETVNGIVGLLDDLQDNAEKLGYPVVWSYDISCDHCGGDCPVNDQNGTGEVCQGYQGDSEDGQIEGLIGLG